MTSTSSNNGRTPQPQGLMPNPEQLRALTHPIRLRLLGILRLNGSATATDLARMTGLNTGSTSYHLRILAKYGFIEKDTKLSSGRKLFWKARQLYNVIDAPSEKSPNAEDELDAASGFMQVAASELSRQILQAASTWKSMDSTWQDISTMSDYAMLLTPEEADSIASQVQGILFDAMKRHPLVHWKNIDGADDGTVRGSDDCTAEQGGESGHTPASAPDSSIAGQAEGPNRSRAIAMQFHLFPVAQDLLR
ncbi:MAG: helix-turn-helix domain-containing protein [Bifidobacterium sp.]|uniref:Helix-turn-helix domain-containing protein n=1 Tax=Bifidobacterium fermentum TaxID=3059035 RepID=A0AB39UQJ2_9BIFI